MKASVGVLRASVVPTNMEMTEYAEEEKPNPCTKSYGVKFCAAIAFLVVLLIVVLVFGGAVYFFAVIIALSTILTLLVYYEKLCSSVNHPYEAISTDQLRQRQCDTRWRNQGTS
ncbi:hypothetical protein MTO96_017833 [Rhipicephalus appendiculatus]